jgi:hypothetical protein
MGELLMPFFLTSLVCWCIKLNAVAMQQKCFGEYLGDRVWIRSFVGVNSLSIRVWCTLIRFVAITNRFVVCSSPVCCFSSRRRSR